MTNRVAGLPTEVTFVFSSIYRNDGRLGVLKDCAVEAVMESFEYIKTEPPERVFNFMVWPARRYLDSGLFTAMSKAGAHQTINKHKEGISNYRVAIDTLSKAYLAYLREHACEWDFIVEVDADNIPTLGPRYTLAMRERLTDIVGEKLLPVWHSASEDLHSTELGAWREMIRRYPYVAIGGDKQRDFRLYRHMVNMAHAQGVLVHGLGTTSPSDFKSMGIDTGDSTNWVAGARFGRFVDLQAAKSMDAASVSRLRNAQEYLGSLGVTNEHLLASGKSYEKLFLSVQRELIRQAELRQWRSSHARIRTETSG